MTTKVTALARLRIELNDTGSTKTWTDTYLNDLLDEAVDWYSLQFPLKMIAYKNVVANQRTFAVPTAMTDVDNIELPPGRRIPYDPSTPSGNPVNEPLQAQTWKRYGSNIYIRNGATGDEIGTNYLQCEGHGTWDHLDPSEAWTGPDADVRLLILWCAWQAATQADLNNALQGRASVYGKAALNFKAQLETEVASRRRKLTSRGGSTQ